VNIAGAQHRREHPNRSRRRTAEILFLILIFAVLLSLLLNRCSGTSQRNLPILYHYPTTTLDWTGFRIHASSCDAVSGSSGFASAKVEGTAVVPTVGGGEYVVGQVEVWILNSSGHIIAEGKPWPLPKHSGAYNWVITGFAKNSGRPSSCVVQGINPGVPYKAPQAPASRSNASVDP
jgi:hypothetical protein